MSHLNQTFTQFQLKFTRKIPSFVLYPRYQLQFEIFVLLTLFVLNFAWNQLQLILFSVNYPNCSADYLLSVYSLFWKGKCCKHDIMCLLVYSHYFAAIWLPIFANCVSSFFIICHPNIISSTHLCCCCYYWYTYNNKVSSNYSGILLCYYTWN